MKVLNFNLSDCCSYVLCSCHCPLFDACGGDICEFYLTVRDDLQSYLTENCILFKEKENDSDE